MTAMLEQLNTIMEQASQALAKMDYLECESQCLKALALAREAGQFGYYARILLPLQEARRQRRITATAGDIQIGSGDAGFDPYNWLDEQQAGCLVLSHPHTAVDARSIQEHARLAKKFIEVLFVDNKQDESTWTFKSFVGPDVSCTTSPPAADQDPAQWFIDATEQLGDAALAQVDETLTGNELFEALESRLAVFTDHEKMHQRLAEAARSIR